MTVACRTQNAHHNRVVVKGLFYSTNRLRDGQGQTNGQDTRKQSLRVKPGTVGYQASLGEVVALGGGD